MSHDPDLRTVVEAVVGSFRRLDVPYFVTGSLAGSVHGEFRATNDLDVVASLESRILEPFFADLSADFHADREQARSALQAGTSFNLLHRESYLKVDVFPCRDDFDREALGRAIEVTLPGIAAPLRVATREDILLAKLRWYRMGDETSERQRSDIANLIALNRGKFDDAYLRRWAVRQGVADLMERFFVA